MVMFRINIYMVMFRILAYVLKSLIFFVWGFSFKLTSGEMLVLPNSRSPKKIESLKIYLRSAFVCYDKW